MPRKYPRIPHFPFSPGICSDDKVNHDYWSKIAQEKVVITEKLDGENTCICSRGVYARSRCAQTKNPWADYLKGNGAAIRNDLDGIELFGENLYAVHSIEYTALEHYFYLFAVRLSGNSADAPLPAGRSCPGIKSGSCFLSPLMGREKKSTSQQRPGNTMISSEPAAGEQGRWLSWDEVNQYAQLLGFPVVPVIETVLVPEQKGRKGFEEYINRLARQQSLLGGQREGLVVRVEREFADEEFRHCILKWVRPGHVRTDKHWRRNWKKAMLKDKVFL